MVDLSIIIPARSEQFLSRTIDDLLKNIRGNTEIIAVLDGNWPNPPVKDNPRVTLIYHSQSIGQRAAMNEAAKLSRAKYIMKLDAHCSVDEGFDVKMIETMQDDWTMVPIMRNLHVFDWVCEDDHRRYQGPSGPCKEKECGKPTKMDVVWIAKTNPQSTTYTFDPKPHFQYFNDFKTRPAYKEPLKQLELTETMSLQGSCFMMTREKYWELGICDEAFGSWGSQGLEVAIKTWLSGGRVICNHKTWYGHCFRTQGGDFGFPYEISGRQVERAKKYAHDLFFNNKWPKQKYPLSWLVEKFWPVQHWKEEDLTNLKKMGESFIMTDKKEEKNVIGKELYSLENGADISRVSIGSSDRRGEGTMEGNSSGIRPEEKEAKKEQGKEIGIMNPVRPSSPSRGIIYYSDCQLDPEILEPCQKQLLRCSNGHKIVSVTLKPMDFGENYTLPLERSVLTMFKQILEGIKRSTTDILFFTEHDCLYTKEHFQFTPPRKDVFYYNENQWQVDVTSGRALFYHCMRLSAMCAYRELLLEHYTKRVERVEKEGFTLRMGYEPGGHRYPRGVDNYGRERFMTPYPLIDLRHSGTVSPNRWRKRDFRNQGPLWSWVEADAVPYFGKTKGRMPEFLRDVSDGIGRSNQ